MGTRTQCGRRQSQCPAWATGKPPSPKQAILDLRDHVFAKAPWLLAALEEKRDKLSDKVKAEADRPLVGKDGGEAEEHRRKHLAESAKIVLDDRTTATVVELLS
jgi:Fe-S oxidoreductase